MIVTRSELSRILGISRAAVTNSIKSGRLVSNSDGDLDLNNKINIDYFKRKEIEIPKSKEPFQLHGSRSNNPGVKPVVYNEDTTVSKSDADIKRIQAQTRLIDIRLAEKMKTLVSRDLIDSVFSKLNSVVLDNLAVLGSRVLPLIAGVVKIDDQDILIKIQEIIDKEMERSINEIKRVTLDEIK